MNALDKLGLAIANAGYVWTPEMREAYEEGIKKQWVGLTDDEVYLMKEYPECCEVSIRRAEAKLKEKNT